MYENYEDNEGTWLGDGLFNCFDECNWCFITWCLPCVTYAENGMHLYGGGREDYIKDFLFYCVVQAFTGLQCILGCMRRTEIRRKYNLPEEPCNDCCIHWCCHPCALCQEHRELKIRAIVGTSPEMSMQQTTPLTTAEETLMPQQPTEAPKVITT